MDEAGSDGYAVGGVVFLVSVHVEEAGFGGVGDDGVFVGDVGEPEVEAALVFGFEGEPGSPASEGAEHPGWVGAEVFGSDPPGEFFFVARWGFFGGAGAVEGDADGGSGDLLAGLQCEPVGYLLLRESLGYQCEKFFVGWQDTSCRHARKGNAASR